MEGEAQVSESAPSATPEAVTSSPETIQESHSETTQESSSDGKPSGFDRVEFTPEQQARIDRIYGNMKRYEGDATELKQQNQALMKSLEQLYQSQNQIVSHIQTNDYQEAEKNLQAQRENAWKNGDLDGYHKANDAMVDIRTRKALAEGQKNQPKPPAQQSQNVSGERLVNTAIDKGEINSVDANIAKAWMSETDTVGNLKRGWTQASDPRNYAAALEAQAVFNSPLYADKSMADKLREIDKRMGLQVPQPSGQNVLGAGNLTRGGKNNNIKLTDVERTIAVRTKFGGSKAKSDEDHAQAYLQAKIKSQPKGASR